MKVKKLIRKLQELDPDGNAEVIIGPKGLGIGKVVREEVSIYHDLGGYVTELEAIWIKNERQ